MFFFFFILFILFNRFLIFSFNYPWKDWENFNWKLCVTNWKGTGDSFVHNYKKIDGEILWLIFSTSRFSEYFNFFSIICALKSVIITIQWPWTLWKRKNNHFFLLTVLSFSNFHGKNVPIFKFSTIKNPTFKTNWNEFSRKVFERKFINWKIFNWADLKMGRITPYNI